MAKNGDSRPFLILRQNAEDFMSAFESDVKSCADVLDSKLTALICDPDSVGSPSKDGGRLSAHLEFTKSKYDIFMNITNLYEKLEESWKKQLEEMKIGFLESVEILLASMKLTPPESKKSLPSRNRKGEFEMSSPSASSIRPYSLLSTAKRIPVLNTFLQKEEEEMDVVIEDSSDEVSKNSVDLPRARKLSHTSPQLDKTVTQKPTPRRQATFQNMRGENAYSVAEENEQEGDDENLDDVEEIPLPQPQVSARVSRRSTSKNTPVLKESSVSGKSVAVTKEKVSEGPVLSTPTRRANRGRKSILKPESLNESELHATPSRSTRKRTAVKETTVNTVVPEPEIECNESDLEVVQVIPKTPKNVHFSVGLDVNEDLEIYSPEVNVTKSTPRRKTAVIAVGSESFSDINLTPDVARSKSKRKTFSGSAMDVSAVPSPKRFKRGGRASVTPAVIEEAERSDLLDSDESTGAEHYTPWLLLEDLDGKIPAQPGVYELKVYKAKKSAYIGSCPNLREKLTLHKIGQNSGHKHLDKFLERNRRDVQVRYEKFTDVHSAEKEKINRIKAFVGQHKTTPAYN